jgi:chromosome segregation ATPase
VTDEEILALVAAERNAEPELCAAIEQLLADRDEYKREWESACERLAADPHGAKLLGERVAELLAERDAAIRELEDARTTHHEALGRLLFERDAALARCAELERQATAADSERSEMLKAWDEQRARCAELEAEVAKLRGALRDIGDMPAARDAFVFVAMVRAAVTAAIAAPVPIKEEKP